MSTAISDAFRLCLSRCYRCFSATCGLFFRGGSSSDDPARLIGRTLRFPSGPAATPARLLAEGGFSYVYADASGRYAVKALLCADAAAERSVLREVDAHRRLAGADHVLPLLGHTFVDGGRGRWGVLLLPLVGASLRDVLNRRLCLDRSGAEDPLGLEEALRLFGGIADAVGALHAAGLTHRDVKVENVLLDGAAGGAFRPLLMDLGSAGPDREAFRTRGERMGLAERAAEHTTVSVRAPELFEGGVAAGDVGEDGLDLRPADVWSLGCVLFALLYGYSPFECEFRADGTGVRVAECSHLRVLGDVPAPPPNSRMAARYPPEIAELLVRPMCRQDRSRRPDVGQVREMTQDLLQRCRGGTIAPRPTPAAGAGGDGAGEQEDPFDQWVAGRV